MINNAVAEAIKSFQFSSNDGSLGSTAQDFYGGIIGPRA